MTEKRFLLTEQFNGLQGVTFVKDDCADVDTYYTVDGTVDLLNDFSEENGQLEKEKERYKRLSKIRQQEIDNRILTIKEFINNCSDNKVRSVLKELFYSEVKEYDLSAQNRKLLHENEKLKSENRGLQSELQIFKEDVTHSNLQINKLADENEQLKNELRIYRKLANCGNCQYHNYDTLFGSDDEYEVCDKGNDITEGICKDWREL